MMAAFNKQKGFSLVELMVGIAVSLVVLAGVGSFYVNTLFASSSKASVQGADQTLRALMDYMVSEIRRANYAAVGTTLAGSFSPASGAANTCVTFSHSTALANADVSGNVTVTADSETYYGFALANSAIYVSKTVTPISCATFSVTAANWSLASDPSTLSITSFTVDSSAYPVVKLSLAGTVVNQKTSAGTALSRSANAVVKIRNS